MDPRANPYHPSPGVTPAYIGGRQTELQLLDTAFARLQAGITDTHPLFAGETSTGKTVLLNEAAARAKAKGWLVASLEGKAGYGIVADIVDNIGSMLDQMGNNDPNVSRLKTVLDRIRSIQLAVLGNSVGLSWAPPPTPTIPLGNLFDVLGEVVKGKHKAVVFCVDEMDQLTQPELQLVLGAMHRANQIQAPIMFVGAGGLDLRARLESAKDYGKAFAIDYLQPLSLEESAKVLQPPQAEYGQIYQPDALNYLAQCCGGNPYQLQLHGASAWNLAEKAPITLADAQLVHQACLKSQSLDQQMAVKFSDPIVVDNQPSIDDTMTIGL